MSTTDTKTIYFTIGHESDFIFFKFCFIEKAGLSNLMAQPNLYFKLGIKDKFHRSSGFTIEDAVTFNRCSAKSTYFLKRFLKSGKGLAKLLIDISRLDKIDYYYSFYVSEAGIKCLAPFIYVHPAYR